MEWRTETERLRWLGLSEKFRQVSTLELDVQPDTCIGYVYMYMRTRICVHVHRYVQYIRMYIYVYAYSYMCTHAHMCVENRD